MTNALNSSHCMVDSQMNGIKMPADLDTGTGNSSAGRDVWEKLGKPTHLAEKNKIVIFDMGNQRVSVKGICYVEVLHDNQKRVLPLLIKDINSEILVGANWFESLRFDFNSIFNKIKVIPG